MVLIYRPPEGWKAELAWMAGYVVRQFICARAVTHPTTNGTQCRATYCVDRDQRVTATLNKPPLTDLLVLSCNADRETSIVMHPPLGGGIKR